MPAKPYVAQAKNLTLEQRIQRGIETHQYRFDDYRTVPDPHLHCQFCDGSILLDYTGLGYQEMNRRLIQFISVHNKCEPRLATKNAEMTLTPKERIGRNK